MRAVVKKKYEELEGVNCIIRGLSRWAQGIVKLSSNEHIAHVKEEHAQKLKQKQAAEPPTRFIRPFSWDAVLYTLIGTAVILVLYHQCRMEVFQLPKWPVQDLQCYDLLSHGFLLLGTLCIFAVGAIGLQCTPFDGIGILMANRVVHSGANWEQNGLRSMLEFSIWIGCTVVTRHFLDSVAAATAMAFLSGALFVTIGDYFTARIKAVEPYVVFFSMLSGGKCSTRPMAPAPIQHRSNELGDESITDYVFEHFGPLQTLQILLFAYGHQIFNLICIHQRNIVLAFILSTLSGATLAMLAKAMSNHERLGGFADILRGRVYNKIAENWTSNPLRSAVEILLFVFSVHLGNKIYDDFFVAIQLGVLTHLICVLAQETVDVETKVKEQILWNEHMFVLLMTLIFLTATIFYVITFSLGAALTSVVALTLVGVNIVLLSECFLALSCTAQVGRILRGRLLDSPANWASHPVRSFFESCVMVTTCLVIYNYTRSIFVAFMGSTWISIALILVGSVVSGDICFDCCSRRRKEARVVAEQSVTNTEVSEDASVERSVEQLQESTDASLSLSLKTVDSTAINKLKSQLESQLPKVAKQSKVSTVPTTVFSMVEVQEHCTPEDCWIVVDKKVYDVTEFAESHPGGEGVVHSVAGMEASQQFHAMHGNGRAVRRARLMMKKYCIGEVREDPYEAAGSYAVKGKDSLVLSTPRAANSNRGIDGNASDSTSPSSNRQGDLPRHNIAAGDAAFTELRNEIMSDPDLWNCRWSDTLAHMARAIPFLVLTLAALWYVNGFTVNSMHTNNTWTSKFLPITHDNELRHFEPSTWWIVALAGWSLGMFWHQSAFIAHDACHRGTPENHGVWHWFGCIYGSFIFGISTAMWGDEHYQHHVATRRPHGDPQFEYYPICLLSLKELDENHPADLFAKILFRIQHIIFLPIAVIVGRINFHGISLAYAIKRCMQYYVLPRSIGGKPRPQIFRPEFDLIGMAFYFAYQYALIVQIPFHYSLDAPYDITGALPRVIFFVIAQWTCGCLHLQLLVSHIGVECFTQEEQFEQSWFSHQVLTSRNVFTSWWNGWYWGGLEYQIEHHLFPRLPRASLAKIAPRVKALCEEHNLPYRCDGQLATVLDVVDDMNAVGILACEIPS